MYKIKNTLALVITLFLSLTSASAFAATWDQFAMKEIKVVDVNTLKVSFTKDLLEDTSMFEFLLTSKKDDTKEIALTGITLSPSSPAELTVKTLESLVSNEEYNLVVVFASDKGGKLIENGVDGMITFKVPTTFDSSKSGTWTIDGAVAPTSAPASGPTDSGATPNSNPTDSGATPNATPTDGTAPTDGTVPADEAAPMDAAPVTDGSVSPMDAAPAVDANAATGWLTPENAAASANPTEVKTWPEEMMIIILAMTLGLGLMYTRRRKA